MLHRSTAENLHGHIPQPRPPRWLWLTGLYLEMVSANRNSLIYNSLAGISSKMLVDKIKIKKHYNDDPTSLLSVL